MTSSSLRDTVPIDASLVLVRGLDGCIKFHYYPETDSLYIDLSARVSVDSREVAPGVVLDFDAGGCLVGIDIDCASRIIDLSCLEAEALPISSLSLMGS